MHEASNEPVAQAAVATVDESGLFAELANGNPVGRSEFELLLEKPVEPAMGDREKIIRTAIEAVLSGEFHPRHGYYYSHTLLGVDQPCGCAIAALYYAGHRLGFVDNLDVHSRWSIHNGLSRQFSENELVAVERNFEHDCRSRADVGECMVQCLESMQAKE